MTFLLRGVLQLLAEDEELEGEDMLSSAVLTLEDLHGGAVTQVELRRVLVSFLLSKFQGTIAALINHCIC